MKLTYRGNSYETNDRINSNSDSTDRLPIKLIYRGETYYCTPRSVAASEEISTDGETVTLTYRGTTYERKIQGLISEQTSLAFNWHWHLN